MIPLERLDLEADRIASLTAAGITSVEELCTKTLGEVGNVLEPPKLEGIKRIRMALSNLGMDLRVSCDDPVGIPNFPSRKALLGLFDLLELAPTTRRALRWFLLRASTREELLAAVDPNDEEKIRRLLELMPDANG